MTGVQTALSHQDALVNVSLATSAAATTSAINWIHKALVLVKHNY
jgi:hypothetical protein